MRLGPQRWRIIVSLRRDVRMSLKSFLKLSALLPWLMAGCVNIAETSRPPGLPVRYSHKEFGLTIFLPVTWQGYSVAIQQWRGMSYLPDQDRTGTTAEGPMIVLRHPRVQSGERWQDMPIMVFTHPQWAADKQGRFATGAGGFDQELWHNSKYVFALSSRYNADDSVNGWKEVAEILVRNQAANAVPPLYPE